MNTALRPQIGIIEDDADLREEFEFLLRARGYIVWSAGKAESFLRQLQVARADIALIDLTLPDADGLELVRQLQKERSRGLIVVTARGDLRTKLEAMRLGADHFLVKPVDLQELLVTIEATWRRIRSSSTSTTQRGEEDGPGNSWIFDPIDRKLCEPSLGPLEGALDYRMQPGRLADCAGRRTDHQGTGTRGRLPRRLESRVSSY